MNPIGGKGSSFNPDASYNLTIGTPMVSGQSCGFEGTNVSTTWNNVGYVNQDAVLSHYPTTSFTNKGKSLFGFDTPAFLDGSLNATCPSAIYNVDASQFSHYVVDPSNSAMKVSSTCKVTYPFPASENYLAEENTLQTQLSSTAKIIVDGLASLSEANRMILEDITNSRSTRHHQESFEMMDEMKHDSEIVVLQKSLQYTIWGMIAAITVIVSIYLMRKPSG